MPDIFFVAKENLSRLKDNYLEGPADLVVEIISSGSRTIDQSDKFLEYQQGGVREYWLLDPERKHAEFYRRDAEGVFQLVPIGGDNIYRSVVLEGLWVDVRWLWRRPPLMDVLKAWGLI